MSSNNNNNNNKVVVVLVAVVVVVEVEVAATVKKIMVALSLLARIWGECSTIRSPPALFLLLVEVEISSRTLIPLFMPGSVHRGSAS